MRNILLVIFLLTAVVAGFYIWNNYKGIYFANKPSSQSIVNLIQNPGTNQTNFPLKIPAGYTLSVFASNLKGPRDLALDASGTIVASLTGAGKIVAFPGGHPKDVLTGLNLPHGIAFYGNEIYIAETNKVSIYDYDSKNYKSANGRKIIDLQGGGEHFTRSLLIKDNKLYVAEGSDCNACAESDPHRAAIWQADLDGGNFRLYASGLRNSVFLTTNPATNEIWATNMGRDNLGDDIPPDTVNIIKDGANYGWPYCYGNKVIDNQTNAEGKKFDCSKMESPKIEIQAHSAPLGLAFIGRDLLIAYHGSWNRSIPTGYKVVKYSNGVLEDFITGWLEPNGNVLGRPVDILAKSEKEIYISDDKAGVIYLLSK